MNNQIFKRYTKLVYIFILLSFLFCMSQLCYAQLPKVELLSRAKAITTHDCAFIPAPASGWPLLGYPGYPESGFNFFSGQQAGLVVYAKRLNEAGTADTTIVYVNYQLKFGLATIVEDAVLHKNYNFSQSLDKPEEYITGKCRVQKIPLDIESEVMAWSLPRYDDFILYKVKVINPGTREIKDLRLGLKCPWIQSHQGYAHDQKYLWNEERKGFVFYDDRIFDWETEIETPFPYGPGPETGDSGDPLDIEVPNAIKHELMSTTLYTCAGLFVPPDKNGDDALHYNILHTDNGHALDTGIPDYEAKPLITDTPEQILKKLSHEQPRMSWDEAKADASTKDGNKYERKPLELISFGPYDLASGASVEIVFGYIFGQMAREKIVKGGLEATRTFVQEGLDSLYKNWDAALELINNNYKPIAYPPPTIGEKGDNLSVESEPGYIKVSFDPIPENYVDPIKNENDVAGYRIYRSNYSFIGPWEIFKTINKGEAVQYMVDGQIVVEDDDVTLGIGYYYTVTTFDTDGLESAGIAYNRYPVLPKRAPGAADASGTYVVPNPFRVINKLIDSNEWDRISFINVPSKCTIRIYTVAGDLVREIKHNDGFGEQSWGSQVTLDLMATRYWKYPAPGIYVYQVESEVSGHEGEKFVGKLAIIR